MSLVMVPACAKAADGAAPTQQNIKTKAAGSLARELVIHGPPFFDLRDGSSTLRALRQSAMDMGPPADGDG